MTQSVADTDFDALVLRIGQHQDKQAFTELFNAVAGRLKGYALRCGAHSKDADEIVQETLVLVWRKAHMFDPAQASALTWLFTLVRNKRIDLLRKNKPQSLVSIDLYPDLFDEPSQEPDSDLLSKNMRNWLQKLPNEQRQVLYKVYFEGKTHSEISDDIGVPVGTVKSRLRLALSKFEVIAKQHFLWLLIIQLTNY